MVFPNFAGLALAALLSIVDPLSFEYQGQTDGKGRAVFVIKANDDLRGVEVVIKGDGQTIKKSIGVLGAGQSYKVKWTQRSGQASYQLELKGKNVEASYSFDIVKPGGSGKGGAALGKLKVRSTRDDIIKHHKASFEASAALSNYEYKIYDTEGDVAASDLVTDGVAAGKRFTLSWDPGIEVFMIYVRGEDRFGRFTEYKLVPWAVEIPHTEINFDSGKSAIKRSEAIKLDEAVAVAFHELDALERVNEAVGANLTPRLYIVGYTDTVGKAGKNQTLSNGRAKAIAGYFRDKGFWAAISYAGMGERGLAVKTDDGVDEVRNRRALYLLGVQQPGAGGQIPSRWSELVGARPRPAGFTLPELPEKWKDYKNKRKRDKQAAGSGSGGSNMADQLPDGGGGTDSAAKGGVVSMPDADAGSNAGGSAGPPAIEGEPGAASKGCSVGAPQGPQPTLLALLGLVGLAVVRRKRQAA